MGLNGVGTDISLMGLHDGKNVPVFFTLEEAIHFDQITTLPLSSYFTTVCRHLFMNHVPFFSPFWKTRYKAAFLKTPLLIPLIHRVNECTMGPDGFYQLLAESGTRHHFVLKGFMCFSLISNFKCGSHPLHSTAKYL